MISQRKPVLFVQCRPAGQIATDEAQSIARMGNLVLGEDLQCLMLLEQPELEVTNPNHLDLDQYSAVIISGSPFDALSTQQPQLGQQVKNLARRLLDQQLPTLGICFGMQIISLVLGGKLNSDYPENLQAVNTTLTVEGQNDPLSASLGPKFQAFTGHSDALSNLPNGAVCLGTGDYCPYQLVRFAPDIYGCQFHPEIDWSGMQIRIATYGGQYYAEKEKAQVIARCCTADVSGGNNLITKFIERYYH